MAIIGGRSYSFKVKMEYEEEVYPTQTLQRRSKLGGEKTRKDEKRFLEKSVSFILPPRSPKLVSMKEFNGLYIAPIFLVILVVRGVFLERH